MIPDEVAEKAKVRYAAWRKVAEQTAKGLAAIFAFVNYLNKKIEQDVTAAAEQSLEEKITDLVSKEASSASLKHIFHELKTEAERNLLDDDLDEVSVQYEQNRKLTVTLCMYHPCSLEYKSDAPVEESFEPKNHKIVHKKLVALGFNYDAVDTRSAQDGYVGKKVGDDIIKIRSSNAGHSFEFLFNPSKPASLTEIAEIITGDVCGITLTDKITLVGYIRNKREPSQKSAAYFNKALEEFNKNSEVQFQLEF